MALGRAFLADEDRPNGPHVAVITEGLWRAYFAADPELIGKHVQLNGRSCAIVGVLPRDFQFELSAAIFTPLQMRLPDPGDNGHNTDLIARLKPGVTLRQAQAEADGFLQPFRQAFPNQASPRDRGVRLVRLREEVVGDSARVLFLLFGAVGFVLLIACANVANLLLARGCSRNAEMAVRMALGAGRRRLLRQLFTENVLLAVTGGLLGVFIAWQTVPSLLALSPSELPRAAEIKLDARVILFALLVSLVTTLLFGSVPALQTARLDINQALKSSSSRTGPARLGNRMRKLLVISEVSLSLVLLVGAALLVVSFMRLRTVGLGFDPRNLTTMQASLNSQKYKTTASTWELERRVSQRIATIPGVTSVATVPSLPMERGLNNYLTIVGRDPREGMSVECRAVSPDYFRTLGIALLAGRALSESDDRASSPVIVINERLASRFFKDTDPIGRLVVLGAEKCEIVGVVSDIKEMGLDQPVQPTAYMSMPQVSDSGTVATNRWFLASWIVRTQKPLDIASPLTSALRDVDPELPVAKIRSMSQVVSDSITPQRFIMTLMGIFAAIALAFTALGLYGVLSYQVSQRTQDIGVRVALGAGSRDVIRLILLDGIWLTAVGMAIGLTGAFALTRLIESQLYDVRPADPVVFAGTALVLSFVAILASLVPARRALRVDPIVALRCE